MPMARIFHHREACSGEERQSQANTMADTMEAEADRLERRSIEDHLSAERLRDQARVLREVPWLARFW
jgi:hypothetical protein